MRIVLGQINTIVGDIEGNRRKVLEMVRRACDHGAELLVLPELALVGYPPQDLLEHRALARAAADSLEHLVRASPPGLAVIVGSIDWPNDSALPRNVAHVIQRGEVLTVAKRLLPTYDVFDEARHFASGSAGQRAIAEIGGVQCGILICEDMWNDDQLWSSRRYDEDPAEELVAAGAQLLINVSASPFDAGKVGIRARLVRHAATRHGVGVAMCNLVGGNDSLIFDGASMAANPGGRLAGVAGLFSEDVLLVTWKEGVGFVDVAEEAHTRARAVPEIALLPPPCHVELASAALEEAEQALCLGLRDYVHKLGFEQVTLGLSGGIDSALVAHLAARSLGGKNVLAVEMPSPYTSLLSREVAGMVVDNLDLQRLVLPIEGPQNALLRELEPCFEGLEPDITEENLQARVRGTLLMALSNKLGHLVLATGNKSEMAVGYCTLYGDMSGGLAVISDLLKLQVYALSRRINEREGRDVIPRAAIERPASAELRPDQTDQEALPPYEKLDPVLVGILEDRLEDREIAEKTGNDESLVSRVRTMVDAAEFKRHQAPPALRVSRKAWHGRHHPIVQRFRPG
jgi:NAD+ synthetase